MSTVSLSNDVSPTDHLVVETMLWGNHVSFEQLDDPRTDPGDGIWEQELLFNMPGSADDPYCEREDLPFSIASNVPPPAYEEFFPGDDTFSVWFHTESLVRDQTYTISIECQSPSVSSWEPFGMRGQLSHCHPSWALGCDPATTFKDEYTGQKVRSYPLDLPNEPLESEDYLVGATFGGNAGFESTPAAWTVWHGSKDWRCSGSPHEGGCFLRFVDDGSGNVPVLRMTHYPDHAILGWASILSEFYLRCPAAQNPDGGCAFSTGVRGYDQYGNEVAGSPRQLAVETMATGTGWGVRGIKLDVNDFPVGTVSWRFFVSGGVGDVLDVDYHQQTWHVCDCSDG